MIKIPKWDGSNRQKLTIRNISSMKINFLLVWGILALGLFLNPVAVKAQNFELSEEEEAEILEQLSEDYSQAFEEAIEGVAEEVRDFPGLLGIVDIVYGTAETRRANTITGSDLLGFRFPCLIGCAYIELAGAGNAYGKQWISGKYQKVLGGTGALGALYNFREPTGRFPLSPEFKFVLWDVNESDGSAEFRAFFRVCNPAPINCTPYVLPPEGISLGTVHEKDLIFLGVIEPGL